VAASGLEGLIWLIVGIIWLVFQGLANATKRKAPPVPRPSLKEEKPEQPSGDELRDFFEALSGKKAESSDPEEAPALPRPVTPPARTFQRTPAAPPARRVAPPPVSRPAVLTAPVIERPMTVTASLHTPDVQWRVAPLLRMKWPRSALGNLSVTAATRTGHASPLHRRLTGTAALRHAMISRIVLGAPGGR